MVVFYSYVSLPEGTLRSGEVAFGQAPEWNNGTYAPNSLDCEPGESKNCEAATRMHHDTGQEE